MKVTTKYQYRCRPEYESNNILIEFFSEVENENFIPDILNAITEINPKLNGIQDLWFNDEIILEIKSDIGNFTFSKDTWGFAFIMSTDNQLIETINSILLLDKKFEKIEG